MARKQIKHLDLRLKILRHKLLARLQQEAILSSPEQRRHFTQLQLWSAEQLNTVTLLI